MSKQIEYMPDIHYVDNSVIVDIFERSDVFEVLPEFLQRNNGCLGLSEENFFELASSRIEARTKSIRRRTLDALLSGTIPLIFLKSRGVLRNEELRFLRSGYPASVNPVVSIDVDMLRRTAKNALSEKYSSITRGNPKVLLPAIRSDLIQRTRDWFPNLQKMNHEEDIVSFELDQTIGDPDIGLFNAALNQNDINDSMLETFVRHRPTFRTLDAMYRTQCYFVSRIPHGKTPSPRGDVVTDVMHLVEAAHAHVLITGDRSQAKEAAIVLPHVKVLNTADIGAT